MKHFLKNNLFSISLATSVVIILIVFLVIFYSFGNDTFYVKDLMGDRNALDSFKITGVIYDGDKVGKNFSIANGDVTTENEYLTEKDVTELIFGDDNVTYSVEYNLIPFDDNGETKVREENGSIITSKSTSGADVLVSVSMSKNRNFDLVDGPYFETGEVKILTDVKLKSDENMEFEQKEMLYGVDSYHTSDIDVYNNGIYMNDKLSSDNSFVFIDGKMYFTVVADNNFTGTNGIYRVNEFGEFGNVKKMVEYSMNDNNINSLGIETVDNKILLVMTVDNILTFRLYDLKGALIDELKVSDKYNFDSEIKFKLYKTDESTCFRVYNNREYFNNGKSYIAALSTDKNKLVLKCFFESNCKMIYDIAENNYNLIVTSGEFDEMDYLKYGELGGPTNIKIDVYDIGSNYSEKIYEGKIVTDAPQDWIKKLNKFNKNSELTNIGFRNFYNIDIQ